MAFGKIPPLAGMKVRRFAPAVLVFIVANPSIGTSIIPSHTVKEIHAALLEQTTVDTEKSEDKALPITSKDVAPRSEETPLFHASSSLVLVDVLTQDSKTGLPLNELKQDDFRVLDNGHQVSVLTFDSGAHFGTRPIALWFLMICNQKNWDKYGSGFMRNKALLLKPALDHLDKRDTAGVAHWCDNGKEAIDLLPTTDRNAPIAKIEEVQHREPTEVGACTTRPTPSWTTFCKARHLFTASMMEGFL